MGDITNIESDDESFVKYRWNYQRASTRTTQQFDFGKLGACTLTLQYTNNNSTYNFRIKCAINFIVKPLVEHNFINLLVQFNSSLNGVLFTLNKTNDMTFTSEEVCVYQPLFYSSSSFIIYIKTYVKNNVFPNNEFVTSMKKLLLDKTYSDLKLNVDNKTFHVHKNILSARNTVFAKMIEADMLEKKTSTINLPQWDPMVVEQLINYIYTNTCNVSLHPHELFKLAHYLEIEPLQNLCEKYIRSNLNMKNIVDSIKLASHSQYELSCLKKAAEQFVQTNESSLANDLDYVEHLIDSISIENIGFILRFISKYEVECLLQKTLEFVTLNYKEIMKNNDCQKFIISDPQLMFKLWMYSLDIIERSNEVKEEQ